MWPSCRKLKFFTSENNLVLKSLLVFIIEFFLTGKPKKKYIFASKFALIVSVYSACTHWYV